jgi:hypothetical protein
LAVGISARTNWFEDPAARVHARGPALKAGQPVVVTHSNTTVVR